MTPITNYYDIIYSKLKRTLVNSLKFFFIIIIITLVPTVCINHTKYVVHTQQVRRTKLSWIICLGK